MPSYIPIEGLKKARPKEEGSDMESPAQAGYLPPEAGPFQCQHCSHFQAPNSCDKVSGVIAPEGCCNYYKNIESGVEAPGEHG